MNTGLRTHQDDLGDEVHEVAMTSGSSGQYRAGSRWIQEHSTERVVDPRAVRSAVVAAVCDATSLGDDASRSSEAAVNMSMPRADSCVPSLLGSLLAPGLELDVVAVTLRAGGDSR